METTTASWLDNFHIAATNLQEFLEQLSQRITNQH